MTTFGLNVCKWCFRRNHYSALKSSKYCLTRPILLTCTFLGVVNTAGPKPLPLEHIYICIVKTVERGCNKIAKNFDLRTLQYFFLLATAADQGAGGEDSRQ